jgi:hypothetical protein
MQVNAMNVQAQPFLKLAQANMELFTHFSVSPEVTSQSAANAMQGLQQATESAMKLMQSGAYAHLLQGLMKNYAEFVAELGQNGMAMMSEGQAAMTQGVQQAADNVIDSSDMRGRRTRNAA